MALTQEQVYNLGIGDEIIVHGKCEDVYGDGDIRVNTYWTVAGEKREQSFLVHSSYVSLPPEKPKYDPCRLFRKGDKVRVVERNGRKFWDHDPKTIYTVVANEYPYDDQNVLHKGCVGINDGNPQTGSSWNIPFFHIELVTPVEELEPYNVHETEYLFRVMQVVEGGEQIVSEYRKSTHPHAKEAAEAECTRLNAEWRKEQK